MYVTQSVASELVTANGRLFEAPQSSPEQTDSYLYFLSSSLGLGHASRAVAIAAELPPSSVTFAAHQNAHPFLAANVTAAAMNHITYGSELAGRSFEELNSHTFSLLDRHKVVINDFLQEFPIVRSAIETRALSTPLIGVYHSIFGYSTDNVSVRSYFDHYRHIAESMDIVFIGEPKQSHVAPYRLENGTQVVHCDPIVRPVTKDACEIKQELGMDPAEEFIYVQGGMSGSKEFVDFANSMSNLGINGLRIVTAPLLHPDAKRVALNGGVIEMPKRMDGQNIVAAAKGVISKPGMGTLCEAIAAQTPVLFLGDADPERLVKYTMLHDILGDLPYSLSIGADSGRQIQAWLSASDAISEKFSDVPCNGASLVARHIKDWQQYAEAESLLA